MVNWTGVVVPIIVGIIAIVGTLIAALVNNYFQSLNKPNIQFTIEPIGTKALINLTNDGLAPATNLTLIIGTIRDFSWVTKEFGAADVIVPQLPNTNQTLNLTIPQKVPISGSYLEFVLPYLPSGTGSLTQIEITNGTSNETFSDFKSSAIFDQGSTMGRLPLSPEEERDSEPIFSFFGGFNNFLLYYTTALAYSTYLLWIFSRRRKRRLLVKDAILSIRERMTDIYSSSEDGKETKKYIQKFIEDWKNNTSLNFGRDLFMTSFPPKYRKFVYHIDMDDYVVIETLYRKLLSHPLYLEADLNPADRKRYSDDCRNLVEEALKHIDWKKFGHSY